MSRTPTRPDAGERDLARLLAQAEPALQPGEWVFVVLSASDGLERLAAIGTFQEPEGLTAICPQERADAAGLPYDGVFRQITMRVHSSLQAVGFLAALTRALADAGVPCNAVSAFHHDHLFVPAAHADEARRALQRLSGE